MRRLSWLLLLAGCANGRSVVEVTIDGNAPGAQMLRLNVRLGALTSQDINLAPLQPAFPPPKTLTLQFDPDKSGAITVHVDALDSHAAVIASGDGQGSVTPGSTTMLNVTLGGPPGDMAALNDLAGSPDLPSGGDGSNNLDLAQPDGGVLICTFDVNNFDDGCIFGP